ncbi:MAG: tRNA uracil 4-sulfurtransferase ThiI [Acutalibacteraceae bacterium]
MKEVILLKVGEIVLKGLNRKAFEDTLMKNIKRRLYRIGAFQVKSAQSTICITPLNEQADLDEACDCVSKIFGIATFSRAAVAEKDMDSIKEIAVAYLSEVMPDISTFKIEAKRSDKKFPLTSPQICMELGGHLLDKFPNLSVDVHNPDVVVTVEVRDTAAYIRYGVLKGAGGIPVGTGGKAAVLISGGIDSPVAAWTMAKRGVELTAVHFASPPYTSTMAEEKVISLLKKVAAYSGHIQMYIVHFTHIQEEIRDKCPEELFTIIMRRFMMRVAQRIARQQECAALITGESLGQVASQTIGAIACTDAVCTMPVFRPLIGMDKEEIVEISRKIDTFDISIQPYEDCCTVFTPKHPRIRPKVNAVEEAEKNLDIDALTEEAMQNLRLIEIN